MKIIRHLTSSLIIIDDEKEDLEVLMDEGNWEMADIVDSGCTLN